MPFTGGDQIFYYQINETLLNDNKQIMNFIRTHQAYGCMHLIRLHYYYLYYYSKGFLRIFVDLIIIHGSQFQTQPPVVEELITASDQLVNNIVISCRFKENNRIEQQETARDVFCLQFNLRSVVTIIIRIYASVFMLNVTHPQNGINFMW